MLTVTVTIFDLLTSKSVGIIHTASRMSTPKFTNLCEFFSSYHPDKKGLPTGKPTDRPTDGPADMSKAIILHFVEGGGGAHNKRMK